jgi:hypothetical protein
MARPHRKAMGPVKYKHNGEERTKWVKLGVSFLARGGEFESITLDALPLNGQIVLMPFDQVGFDPKDPNDAMATDDDTPF